jgi:hypothetical protein
MGSPLIFFNKYAKMIPSLGVLFRNKVSFTSEALNDDPSAVARDELKGSLFLSPNGQAYIKQDSGLTTNWKTFLTSTPSQSFAEALPNNVAYPVANLVFDKITDKAQIIFFDIFRRDDGEIRKETGSLFITHDQESDLLFISVESKFDLSGTSFSINSITGQVFATTDDMAGGNYSGQIRYRTPRSILIVPDVVQFDTAIANNAVVATSANVTFNKLETKSATMTFDIFRRDDVQITRTTGNLFATYDTELDIWGISESSKFEDSGILFSINVSSGEVLYTSSNFLGGNHSGIIRIGNIEKLGI